MVNRKDWLHKNKTEVGNKVSTSSALYNLPKAKIRFGGTVFKKKELGSIKPALKSG